MMFSSCCASRLSLHIKSVEANAVHLIASPRDLTRLDR
jgi:hypothetical protein